MADITLTQEQLAQLKPSPADLVAAVRMLREQERWEESNRSAQERLVMGAFGSWFKRHWKAVVGIGTVILTVSGGAYRAWLWIQAEAETAVLERQATEVQSKAVTDNTAAVSEMSTKHEELGLRVGKLERKAQNLQTMNELLLELQLRDPKIKRLIKSDNRLKSKLDAIPNVDIED